MHPIRFAAAAIGLFAGLFCGARAEDSVAVLSSASPEYVASRQTADGRLVSQSYVVMKGHYREPQSPDASVEKMPFERILEILKPGLEKQAFYPARDFKHADLLLVVHWGVVAPPPRHNELDVLRDQRWQDLMRELNPAAHKEGFSENPDFSVLKPSYALASETIQQVRFMALEDVHEEWRTELGRGDMARSLGLLGELRRLNRQFWDTDEARDVRALLDEDRYFINISAYDARAMVESKKLNRLWIARLSVRSSGMNFRMAGERISAVGGYVFGTDLSGVKITPVRVRSGKVEIKDLQVLK
ncbi:hypothetical protein DB347_08740 [Opitutaceae bacterium EW11]|nr:hypothetical protein DB347_08740 [Opitutaceae bacterium EW11]